MTSYEEEQAFKFRFFSHEPAQRRLAVEIYESIQNQPIVSPHGHVNPRLFSDPNAHFGTPVDLFIIPDHYIFRMLYSNGVALEALGISSRTGGVDESDHRKIWQIFADHFTLFRATPSGVWFQLELQNVFNIHDKLTSKNAQEIYVQIQNRLASSEYQPRKLFDRFQIEFLCTTDSATDSLDNHKEIRRSGWKGEIRPTFRPDAIMNIISPDWQVQLDRLILISGIDITNFKTYLNAIEHQREYFKSLGAVATDHGVEEPFTFDLSESEADAIFQKAINGTVSTKEARVFTANMLIEMARMSVEDGLVMQIHAGSLRNYNAEIMRKFGSDMGADIPLRTEFTRNLSPMLNKFGNEKTFRLVLFTLDESTYSRELAPLAGHFPAVKIGPPWWFHDSINGIRRYLDQVVDTAGIYNLAGFTDDTRAFLSIPARHDVWRRIVSDWLSGLVLRLIIDQDDALEMAAELATGLARKTYNLNNMIPKVEQNGLSSGNLSS